MAHPHHDHKAHKVEHRRVSHITKGYASGGAVKEGHYDEENDKKLIEKSVKKSALKAEGKKPKFRADRRARGGKVRKADGGPTQNPKPPLKPKGPVWRTPGWDDETGTQMTPYEMAQQAKGRARGGRTKHKGTTVNIINSPGHAAGGPPMPPPAMAARPPMPAPAVPPLGAGPGAPPVPPPVAPAARPGAPMMPPLGGMPMRRRGGKAYAKGGAVKDGPAWKEGVRAGTQPKNSPGKNDGKDIGRGKPITYATGGGVRLVQFYAGGRVTRATGGKVESPEGVAPATKLPGGGGGGEARLAKAKRAARDYKRA